MFNIYRYAISEQELPYFTDWVLKKMNINLNERKLPRDPPKEFPSPIITQGKNKVIFFLVI